MELTRIHSHLMQGDDLFWFILVHFANWIHTIFKNITVQKARKYSIETKIPIVLQNLFEVIEKKLKVEKLS